jgi:hypothetical protein
MAVSSGPAWYEPYGDQNPQPRERSPDVKQNALPLVPRSPPMGFVTYTVEPPPGLIAVPLAKGCVLLLTE